MWIVPGQEGSAGGPATGGVVEVGKAQSVIRECVEIRGLDLRTVAAKVGVAEVVCKDEKDVGRRRTLNGEQ